MTRDRNDMTRSEIVKGLKARNWTTSQGSWYHKRRPSCPQGVSLREAASFEGFSGTEDLSQFPVKTKKKPIDPKFPVKIFRIDLDRKAGKIVGTPPLAYEYANGDHMARFEVPSWIKKGAYCYCAGEGDDIFRIDEFKDICAGLTMLSGCDQGWEMLHKLSPCKKPKGEIDVLIVVALLKRASQFDRLSAQGCLRILTSAISAIQQFGDKDTAASIKGDPDEIARKILGQ